MSGGDAVPIETALWPDGPVLSTAIGRTWQCQCSLLRGALSIFEGVVDDGLPARFCIGDVRVMVTLSGRALQLPFLLLCWCGGDALEVRRRRWCWRLPTFEQRLAFFVRRVAGLAPSQLMDKRSTAALDATVRHVRACTALAIELAAPHE